MTRLLIALVIGASASALAWLGARGLFAAPIFARRNVRGLDVPVGAGFLAVVAVVGVHGIFLVFDAVRVPADSYAAAGSAVLVAALGFGLLGIVDDLAGDNGDKGFTGHLRALASGRLTTGAIKLVGGGLLGLTVAGPSANGLGELLLGGAVVALAANTANLFDRAPGRVTKVAVVAFVALVLLTPSDLQPLLVMVGGFVGAVLGLFPFDLREQLMLGDAGANPLGAVLGVGVILTTGPTTQLLVLLTLIVINILGERMSFSAAIERFAPLRALDQLGRRPR